MEAFGVKVSFCICWFRVSFEVYGIVFFQVDGKVQKVDRLPKLNLVDWELDSVLCCFAVEAMDLVDGSFRPPPNWYQLTMLMTSNVVVSSTSNRFHIADIHPNEVKISYCRSDKSIKRLGYGRISPH